MRRYGWLVLVGCVGCSSPTPTAPTPVEVTPPPVVTAPVVTPPVSTPPTPNPLLSDPRFNLTFYHQFTSRPLYRWNRAPQVYLRTVDDTGRAVDASILDQTAAAMINAASLLAGGAFGLAGIERGTETRNADGWINVSWAAMSGLCGLTNLTRFGLNQEITASTITLNPAVTACTCGGVARHELGHAMGYQHTDSTADLMSSEYRGCTAALSEREQFHARVAYSMPLGSLEP